MSVPALTSPLRGVATVPADKSIVHRALLVAALARGRSEVRAGTLPGDCRATIEALRALGCGVTAGRDAVTVEGGTRARDAIVDCGRSATTMRLLAGILAGRRGTATLTGDPQLLRRPMDRVAAPLRRMGADVRTSPGGVAPLRVEGGGLRGVDHRLPVASAQVKSALILAGLRAEGATRVDEPAPSRDHTERLLAWLGLPVTRRGPATEVRSARDPEAFSLAAPGDVSAASVLAAAAAILPGSDLLVDAVGLNPTRTGFLETLRRMGATVETEVETEDPEPVGRLRVRPAALGGVAIAGTEVPGLVDELPLVALIATQAEGTTEVRGAAELRVKESDRIAGVVGGLRALGATIEELPDGFVVRGPTRLRGGACDALGDHRLAMTFHLAGALADGPVRVTGLDRVGDSFPGFLETIGGLR